MEIYNLSESICALEAVGLSKVFDAYADYAAGEDINMIGFNSNSGYIYICLENGISICSAFGQSVEYLINNQETDEEEFFDSYDEAINNL
jgi:hypothetical protein